MHADVAHKQAELLSAGKVDDWNAWRLSDLGARPRMRGAKLSDHSLQHVVLWRMHLENCSLDRTDLRNADLRECHFRNVSFARADLTGAACWMTRFHACDLRGAVLTQANFEECSFEHSTLPQALVYGEQTAPCYWLRSPARPRPPQPPDRAVAIALLGDCTVYTGYLPPSQRPCAVLAETLAEPTSGIPAFVYDLSRDGESLAGLLHRYEEDLLAVPRTNVAFIRYGVTDRKEYGPKRFIELLGDLCRRLETDFPSVHVVIETGMYTDYPKHYRFDRNAKLAPLYEGARNLAAERGHRVVDVFSELGTRTSKGDWDWRIRGLGIGRPASLHDASEDHLHRHDTDWFTNIHPNRRCVRLIAELERDAVVQILR